MAIGERTGGNERALRDRGAVRDDRVLPETRWLAACIVPFLLVASAMLYLFPDRTDTLFAWTIRPRSQCQPGRSTRRRYQTRRTRPTAASAANAGTARGS